MFRFIKKNDFGTSEIEKNCSSTYMFASARLICSLIFWEIVYVNKFILNKNLCQTRENVR